MSENISGAPSAPTTASSTPAPAPASPATQGAAPVSAPQITTAPSPADQVTQQSTQGEPPKERWKDILDNARQKTRAEVEAEYRQKYGQYDAFERDPWSAIQHWLSQASQHSLYGPHVQQWVAQYLQSMGANQAGEEPQADVPIVDANGQVTGYTFSDKQLRAWHQWNGVQQQQELDARLGPLEERAAAMARQEQVMHVMTHTQDMLSNFRQMPYFKEHEADIRQALEEHEEWGDNLHAAYNHVLITKILPTLGQAEQRAVLNSLNSKASGATVAPSGTAPGRPQFKSFKDAAEYFEKHPDEANAMATRTS